MNGLTEKQKRLLVFIKSETRRTNGTPPSYEEMKNYLGLKSKSGVHRIIHALRDRGHIHFLNNCARSIAVSQEAESATRIARVVPSVKLLAVADALESGKYTRKKAAARLRFLCAKGSEK